MSVSLAALAVSINGFITFTNILRNNPSLGILKAAEIAQYIEVSCKKHKVPTKVIVGIAMAESNYQLRAVNEATKDYGILQVNHKTAKRYKLNIKKLTTDLKYSIDSGVKVFSYFNKRFKRDEAIMRYNCGTRKSCIKTDVAKKYLHKVLKYGFIKKE